MDMEKLSLWEELEGQEQISLFLVKAAERSAHSLLRVRKPDRFVCPKYKLFILMPLSFHRGCEIRSDVLSKKHSYYSALPDELPGQSKTCTSNQDMHSSFSKAFRGIKLKI